MITDQRQDKRVAVRYNIDAGVHGSMGQSEFRGHVRDISATGAAIVGNGLGELEYDNDQFVNLHMDGIGEREGIVRRRIPEGFALEFRQNEETEQQTKARLEALAQFQKVRRRDLIG